MTQSRPAPATTGERLRRALQRYRVLAYLVGAALLFLFLVAMPLRYLGGNATVSHWFSPVHGALYMIYVVVAFDLWSRLRWPWSRIILMLLTGFVPFLTLWVEPQVTRDVRARLRSAQA